MTREPPVFVSETTIRIAIEALAAAQQFIPAHWCHQNAPRAHQITAQALQALHAALPAAPHFISPKPKASA